jgi:signal peptidase I
MNRTTKQPSDLMLTMATTPAQPRDTVRSTRVKWHFPAYQLVRFLQRSATVLLILALSVGAHYFINDFLVRSVKVSGTSMVPTLEENSSYLLNMWALHQRAPRHNDIVVIRDPGDHGLSVKRVIAVGGESIHFKDGKVYVNDQELNEPYVLGHGHTFTYNKAKEQIITCGPNEFFVMGDNRQVSIDSRSYGPVSRKDVLGLVEVRQ